MNREAWECKLLGLVQGVGFRPFVHRLSEQYHLNGWVLNSSSGLTILVEGITENLKLFAEELLTHAPPLAKIETCEINIKKVGGYTNFVIRSSESERDSGTVLPPDTGVCEKCLTEFYDVTNVRHHRPIINRCDDSVVGVVNSETLVYRRARGYVPLPIRMQKEWGNVFACGGDLKNTFCIVKGQQAFMSQYFGDLSRYRNYQRYLESIEGFKQMTGSNPTIIAHDLHPGYISTQYANSLEGVSAIPVQHHHAHFASCMAENNMMDATLGVICDGAGYGNDGCIWGFEFLYGDYGGVERLAHLDYLPLVGGDGAVYDPSRTAFSYLYSMFGNCGLATARKVLPHISNADLKAMQTQLDHNIGIWQTSSCGRLFDAVSGLLGVCTKVNYEGQAAMLLEAVSCLGDNRTYGFKLDGNSYPYHLNIKNMFEELLFDIQNGVAKEMIGGRFHATIIDMIVSTTLRLSREQQCEQVALSGGVFQNRLLLKKLVGELENNGLRVYIQRKVPTNDGGLSLGQAIVGEEVFKRVSSCNR